MWFIILSIVIFLIALKILAYQEKKQARWPAGMERTTAKGDIYFWISYGKGKWVAVKTNQPFKFKIQREGKFDSFLKRMGLVNEFQTGDKIFDQSLYIASDDIGLLNHLRNSNRLRDAISKLFESGAKKIEFIQDRILVDTTDPDLNYSDIKIEATLGHLNLIAEELNSAAAEHNPESIRKANRLVDIFISFSLAIGVTGCTMFVLGFGNGNLLRQNEVFTDTVIVGTTASIVIFFIMIRLVGNTSRAKLAIQYFIVSGLMGVYLFSGALLYEINTSWDKTAPEIIQVSILDKQHRYRKRTSYYITIGDWNDNSRRINYKVNYSVYDKIEIGTVLGLHIKKGYLGYDWIDWDESLKDN